MAQRAEMGGNRWRQGVYLIEVWDWEGPGQESSTNRGWDLVNNSKLGLKLLSSGVTEVVFYNLIT